RASAGEPSPTSRCGRSATGTCSSRATSACDAGWPRSARPTPSAGAHGARTRSCISGTPEIRSRAMRAVQITDLSGPDSALKELDLPEPEASHPLTPGSGVVIDVHAAGVSFPELLQTRGEYQVQPDLPFVPGNDVAGVVRSAPEGSGLSEGDRVAACALLAG